MYSTKILLNLNKIIHLLPNKGISDVSFLATIAGGLDGTAATIIESTYDECGATTKMGASLADARSPL